MSKSVSVVVPVYRVEQYLDRCVTSILAQTFSDFELILVDDGSPDRCPQMCDEWAEKDSRIVVMHKKNGGPQDAVNYGVNLAQGEFITFADSDDWVEPAFLETLYRGITEYDADVIQCNYRRISEKSSEVYRYEQRIMDLEYIHNTLLPDMAQERFTVMCNSRCNKIYRSDMMKKAVDLCDASISMGEDYLLNFAVFGLCRKIVVLDTEPMYNYYTNMNSITSSYNPQHKYMKNAFYANLQKIAEKYGCGVPDIPYLKNRRYAEYIYECAISNWSRADKKKEIREIMGMLDRKLWFSTIKTYDIPAKRICLWMSYFGMTDFMLILVDGMKKMKGIE